MDTVFTLRIYGKKQESQPHFAAVHALLKEVEGALSKTIESSDVSRINQERSAGDLSFHTQTVLHIAIEMSDATQGAYLPTMGAVSLLWALAEENNALPNDTDLLLALENARLGLTLKDGVCTILGEGALLDLGGIGKGYAADCVLQYLQENQVSCALLSFGSSVATLGNKPDGTPFEIGLKHPRNPLAMVGTLQNPQGILSVSGDYERYVTVNGEQYHHVIDPADGYPSDSDVASVAVLCESGARSDALSTAFMVMGCEKAMEWIRQSHTAIEAVFVDADGTCMATDGIAFQTK
ncbi:MAG: FAD:protein FMN transferase [Clostridia bacterium]|nr:FAD:protein FMN transferase [Clostridia bacterium]